MFIQSQLWARGVKSGRSESISSLFYLSKLQTPDDETCVEIVECFQLCELSRPQDTLLGKSSERVLYRIWISQRLAGYAVLRSEGIQGFDDLNGTGVFVQTSHGWELVGADDHVIIRTTK